MFNSSSTIKFISLILQTRTYHGKKMITSGKTMLHAWSKAPTLEDFLTFFYYQHWLQIVYGKYGCRILTWI